MIMNMSNPDTRFTATVCPDTETGDVVCVVTKTIEGGIDGPFLTFAVPTDTPLTGADRGVEYALAQHGFAIPDVWRCEQAFDGLRMTCDLEQVA